MYTEIHVLRYVLVESWIWSFSHSSLNLFHFRVSQSQGLRISPSLLGSNFNFSLDQAIYHVEFSWKYSDLPHSLSRKLTHVKTPGHDGLAHTDTAVLTDLRTYGNAIGTVVKYVETFYINNKLLMWSWCNQSGSLVVVTWPDWTNHKGHVTKFCRSRD